MSLEKSNMGGGECEAVGGRATCLFLDTDVVITGWTDARVSWPLCRPLDNRRGRPTVLLDDELACAVRHEAAAAVKHWWGVGVRRVAA
jgi:hypothetical protein